jgi:multidrug resistance efflux pump
MAFPKLTPDPGQEPAQPLPAPQTSSRTWWPAVILLAAVLAAGTAWYLRPRRQQNPEAAPGARLARVVRGTLHRTVRLTGSITTQKFATVSAPIVQAPDIGRGQVLIFLTPSGTDVRQGDVIARMDTEATDQHLDDVEDQVIQMGLNLRRVDADHKVAAEDYTQRAKVAKANLEKAKLDARAVPVHNQIDQELLRIAVEEAQIQYDETERQSPLAEESRASERALAQYSYDYQIRHRGRHRGDVSRSTLRAPISGKVVLRAITRNGEFTQVRLGDEIAPGQPFLRVVDLSNLQLEGSMSQTDSENVRLGQKARIYFDAYPDLVLEGRVDAVGAIAMNGRRFNYYVRRIPIRIAIDGNDPRVIPDLTASADVVIGEEGESLLIPREAVQEAGGKQVVMVKQGESVIPREVEIGAYGNTQVSVISGLQEGDQVVM